MSEVRKLKSALISVFHKDNLQPIVDELNSLGVTIYSTGGTQKFIEESGIAVEAVEDLTSYPSILNGRVKTLHPKIFGGILSRRDVSNDAEQLNEFEIPEIDLVIVDLYPFEETVASGASESDIIEKIDIGGISLIRAAAKNFKDVLIVSSRSQYGDLLSLLKDKNGSTDIEDRKRFAAQAFEVSSHYDAAIFNYFSPERSSLKVSITNSRTLRYGENPHQKGWFYGNLDELLEQKHGKELSYNNLLDIDAAVNLIQDFDKNSGVSFAILKHNNACGMATRSSVKEAYEAALAADPVSAFGGILITNHTLNLEAAELINELFCEVVIAPAYDNDALSLLMSKKNRIILVLKDQYLPEIQHRSILNGILTQDKDIKTDSVSDFDLVTTSKPDANQQQDLEFASKLVKHTKSNAIVLVKNQQLLASGTGQTSRVDALNQAIKKAVHFKFDLNGAVMASDAFFPFPDCVEIAHNAGITAVVQPGGSIRDKDSIEYCEQHKMGMVLTGTRHFKH